MSIDDYSHTRSITHPNRYEYIATMYRNDEQEFTQDGEMFCRSPETAQLVITEWNTMSQLHRANMGGDVVWKYTLKGQETNDQATE